MAIFYRGAGVGTWWHKYDARTNGFTAHSPAVMGSADRLMAHIVSGTVTSPYVSLTRSYGVARSYALVGRSRPTKAHPAFVYEIELDKPLPLNLELVDPVRSLAARVPLPLATVPYQHDGAPTCLIGLIDKAQRHLLEDPCPMPPNSNPLKKSVNLTTLLQTLVFALRDAEVLAIGTIPASCVRFRHKVY